MQSNLVPSVRGLLTDRPGAEIIYYGKAHIPLVFLAGHSLSTGWPVRLYELDPHRGDWWAIDEMIEGDDIGFQLEQPNGNHDSCEVVIRISISYWVRRAEVEGKPNLPTGGLNQGAGSKGLGVSIFISTIKKEELCRTNLLATKL